MAVDSHEENHYNLNNNSTKKSLQQTLIKLESRDDDFGLNPFAHDNSASSLFSISYSSDSSQIYQGSARRKNSTISKGILFEEFLSSPDRCGQLTPIDKLLLKNKAALQSLRMKPNRSKSAPASAAAAGTATANAKSTKKEPKPRKEKVLGSKIAVAKKKLAAAVNETKPATKSAPAAKKSKNAAPAKVEETTKVKSRAKQTPQETKKVPKKEPANVPAAATITTVRKRKAEIADNKTVVKMKKKVNSNGNRNERLTDLRRFKSDVTLKTRSFTKVVKLRNGKSRIIPESKKTPPPSPQSRKRSRRSANSSTTETVVTGSKPTTPFKRSIKQEPLDEDIGIKRKRRKTTVKTTEPPSTPVTPTVVADSVKPLINTAIESVPIPTETPAAPAPIEDIQILPPLKEKPVSVETPAPVSTPVVPELKRPIEDITVVDEELPNDAEMMVEEVLIDDENESSSEPTIEDACDPPVLSPAVPPVCVLDDTIVIDSSEDSDVQLIETPPVISPAAPVPVDDPPPPAVTVNKPDDQLEDTATETSEDTEGDEEFPLQDANTESESIIDEDITLHYETDDEDSTDKDIANEPPVAAVATAADPIQEPKEPVESAREKIPTPPVVVVAEEPIVVAPPSQEKPPKQPDTKVQDDRPENKAVKESILGALGLTSLEKVQQKVKENSIYTGTLKAVIKIDKGCRRMELKPKDSGSHVEGSQNENVMSFYSKIIPNKFEHGSDSGSGSMVRGDSEMHVVNGMDSASFKNKCHDDGLLSSLREANARAMETDYNGLIDPVSGQLAKEKTKAAASLVVPEKSSSFSIHPNRLCSDVCKYCFGKFGSLDTPCHVGQMKNPERQRKILLCEPNLKLDTCLCDACYRFVDRKANKPPQKRNKNNMRRSISINQRSLGLCVIQNCTQFARHTVKRKWLLRISKKIAKLSFDVNKGGPRMRYGLCSQHYYLVDFYTLCGICKKRLNRNHMYSIRSELDDLNNILEEDSIPIKLVDNMLLCKLCHYYMSLRLKYGDSSRMSPSNRQYYQNFRKKILINYNVVISDSEDPITSECLKYESSGSIDSLNIDGRSHGSKMIEELAASSSSSKVSATATTTTATSARSSNPSSSSSSSSKKNNHNVGFRDIADLLKPLEGDGDKNSSTRIQVKFGNLNIGKLSNLNIGQNSSTHQSESKHDKSGDKELPLVADFTFKTPPAGQKNWEKCVSTILFDKGTKKLWQDLQKPYGNQSSFIRHLIMLEKYWRSGALVLAGNADAGAVKYINSVKNRIESLETSSVKEPSPSATSTSPAPPAKTLPTLKPVTSSGMENGTSSAYHVGSSSIKTSTSETSGTVKSSANVRHTPPAPPPLLKIDSMNGLPYGVSVKVVSSSESKVQHHQAQAPQSVAPRNADISLEQYVEMMHPQPRTKHLTQITNGNVKGPGVSLLKKTTPTMPTMKPIHIANSGSAHMMANSSASRITKKSASVIYHGSAGASIASPAKRQYYGMPQLTAITTVQSSVSRTTAVDSSSMIIAKLPKALTVTQIDEPTSKDRTSSGEKPTSISAPFLAGEKPSVSVFREMTK